MASAVKGSRSGESDQRWCSTTLPLEMPSFDSVAAEISLVLEFWRRVGLTYFPGIYSSIGFAVGG